MNQQKAIKQLSEINKLKGNIRLAGENWKTPFQTLISIILSARTLDETTIKVGNILFKKYNNSNKLSKANLQQIQKIIKPINFYKNKSKSIINCSIELEKNYNGKIPLDYNKLIQLSGVGDKTANVFLSEMGKDAIGVDTHVFYISRYLEWTDKTKPIDVEEDLRKLFPKNYWKKLNSILIKFGKKFTSRKEKDKILDEIKNKFNFQS